MGLRETLNQNRNASLIACVVVISITAVVIASQAGWFGGASAASGDRFYTIDEGKTFFSSDVDHLPPFDYQGASALGAGVFRCSSGGEQFVGYLWRYTDDAKAAIADAQNVTPEPGKIPQGQDAARLQRAMAARATGVELRRVGTDTWINRAREPAEAGKLMREMACPEHQSPAEVVNP